MGFPGGSGSKESACNAGDLGLILTPGREDPLDKRMAPTPLFLPGEFQEQWTEEPGGLPWDYRVRHD